MAVRHLLLPDGRFFTYFYTAFQFRPDQTADFLRKNGGFIPGIRPGKPTEEFLLRVTNRITLGGRLFLGALAVLPYLVAAAIPRHARTCASAARACSSS